MPEMLGYKINTTGKKQSQRRLETNIKGAWRELGVFCDSSPAETKGEARHRCCQQSPSEREGAERRATEALRLGEKGGEDADWKSCFQCFVDVQDSLRLCSGHILTQYNIVNVDSCFKKLDHIFNTNERVIEAGRVGGGFDQTLKEILDAEILPMVKEFDQKQNYDTVYERRLQTAADNFIAAASKLPRVSGCFPPCGFQSAGAVYNCITCKYDSCEFPLDCPVEEIEIMEKSKSKMWCHVPFDLPDDIEVIWRFAEKVKTEQMDEFREVTAGVDRLYSIHSTGLQHQGTYQCEIYSGGRSIVRLYFYITVTPQVVTGHTELQEIFDLSLLPGGQLLPAPGGSRSSNLPLLPLLLCACLSTSLLLLFLSLGALYWFSVPEHRYPDEDSDEGGDFMSE
ncbi:sperm acrosome associated 6 [Cololabis saira]|uniref:sperm acrosome associated 6 n=1 Tax=Cololabis saira TaxID=129043 RepID=UPI002AD37B1E|nr:sperm acrosome associated 6 [Cololabis saira]